MSELSGIWQQPELLPRWLGDHHEFLGELRHNGFTIGLTEERRFLTLLVHLCGAGVDLSDSSNAVSWLGPVLCRRPADSANLSRIIDQWALAHSDREAPKKDESKPNITVELSTELKRNTRRTLLAAGAFAAVLLLTLIAFVAYLFLGGEVTPEDPQVIVNQGGKTPIGDLDETLPETKRSLVYAAMVGGMPVALALGFVVYRRNRRVAIARGAVSATAPSVPLHLEKQALFDSRGLRRTFQVLRQHSPVSSEEINVERTIRATIRAGGLVELRYGTRPALPEYVLLFDEMTARDHMSLLAESLSERLKEERIAVTRYAYHGDPRRVRQVGKQPQYLDFMEVAARHPGQRLLMLSGALDIDARRHEAWLAGLESWAAVAILVPDPIGISEATRTVLRQHGISAYEATSDGLEKLGHEIGHGTMGQAGPESRGESRSATGFFTRLEHNRHILLRATAPEPEFVRELIWDLRDWLGPEGFVWFGACAIYPDIRPRHTAYFGLHLKDGEGRNLATDARLARIACLPWLRYGFMPDWLRLAVREALPRARVEEIIRECFALSADFRFTPDDPDDSMALFDKDNAAALGALKDLIRGKPGHSLNDQVFLGAIERKSDRLALDAPDRLRRYLGRRVDRIEGGLILGGLILGLGYFWFSSVTLPLLSGISWLAGGAKGIAIVLTLVALWVHFSGALGLAARDRLRNLAPLVAGAGVFMASAGFVLSPDPMTVLALFAASFAWICIMLDRILPRSRIPPKVRHMGDVVASAKLRILGGIAGAGIVQAINLTFAVWALEKTPSSGIPSGLGGITEAISEAQPTIYFALEMVAISAVAWLLLGAAVVSAIGLPMKRAFQLAVAMLLGFTLSLCLTASLAPYAVDLAALIFCGSLKACSDYEPVLVVLTFLLGTAEVGVALAAIVWLGRQRLTRLARFGPWILAGPFVGVAGILGTVGLAVKFLSSDFGAWFVVAIVLGLVFSQSRTIVPLIGFCRSRAQPGKFPYGRAIKAFLTYLCSFILAFLPPFVISIASFGETATVCSAIFGFYAYQWIALWFACIVFTRSEMKALQKQKAAGSPQDLKVSSARQATAPPLASAAPVEPSATQSVAAQ